MIKIAFVRFNLFIVCLSVILIGCGTTSHLIDKSYMHNYPVAKTDTLDPSIPGAYGYRIYFYGKSDDKHRKEYRKGVDFKTKLVDARPFVKGIDKKKLKERKAYWGFDFDQLPLSGRVWFPSGDGPFPLVLIVHGNHDMTEYSDPGYAYLGELFASRGLITVSVDENFLNGDIKGENDARAFMLLEHLKVWRKWNQTEGHAFEDKVDMDRIRPLQSPLPTGSTNPRAILRHWKTSATSSYTEVTIPMLQYSWESGNLPACASRITTSGLSLQFISIRPTTVDSIRPGVSPILNPPMKRRGYEIQKVCYNFNPQHASIDFDLLRLSDRAGGGMGWMRDSKASH